MDRRDFLKGLATLGAAIGLRVPISEASDLEVVEELDKLAERPFFFEVNEARTILSPWADYPDCRAELYDIDPRPAVIIREITECWPLRDHLGRRWETKKPATLVKLTNEWLEEPLDDYDLEEETVFSGPQGEALSFFQALDLDTLDSLGVVIVEGDCPGSSYRGAELRNDIASANSTAGRLRLPFRFKEEA